MSNLIKQAKTEYYTNLVTECGKDQKALFRVINQIQGKSKSTALPDFASEQETADKFSKFFYDKIADIRQKLDSLHVPPNQPLHQKTVLPLSKPPCDTTFEHFSTMSTDEVTKIISKSPPKSCSLDPLPTSLLKRLTDVLAPCITTIVNKSLQKGYFPADMKKALVTPLLKKPSLDKDVLKNYRPVSNLSFLSKVVEKAAMSQISTYVSANHLLTKFQSAYRSNHSTETALLRVQNDILKSMDSSSGVILILLDLSAGFDTPDHEILMSCLHSRMGLRGPPLNWFQSYLEDRYQTVCVKGSASEPRLLTFGFPQGSVCGPQDFSYYTNEVAEIARLHGISVSMYADDTQLYIPFSLSSPDAAHKAILQIEDCAEDIRKWMTVNKLKLNNDKSELMVILPSRQTHKCSIGSIKIGDCEVTATPSVRNLGVYFDSCMSMKCHINSVIKSANFQLKAIGHIRNYLSSEAAASLIHAFITSKLDYGNSLLFGLPDTLLKRLQKVQNTAARILTRTKKYDHITHVLSELHWLPVEKRIHFKILVLTYKSLNKCAPEYLCELISAYTPPRTLRSSNSFLLKVPTTRLKSYGDRSFEFAAPTLWNTLPDKIKSASSLDIFKSQLKTHLFNNSY